MFLLDFVYAILMPMLKACIFWLAEDVYVVTSAESGYCLLLLGC